MVYRVNRSDAGSTRGGAFACFLPALMLILMICSGCLHDVGQHDLTVNRLDLDQPVHVIRRLGVHEHLKGI